METFKLAQGHKVFKEKYFDKNAAQFKDLVENGQHPKALFIGCSDSRFIPDLIMNAKPGDLFTLRNVGNFVPPYKTSNDFHGTASGIEYAVSVLDIGDLIVCGHSHCGACEAMYNIDKLKDKGLVHIINWLKINDSVKNNIEKNYKFLTYDEKLRMTEKLSIIHQLDNLLTYPNVKEMVEDGRLKLHGWYYKLENGELETYDYEQDKFVSTKI